MKIKQTLLFGIISIAILTSCSPNRQETVQAFLTATNNFDKEKTGQLLADNFSYIDIKGRKGNKNTFLNRQDSIEHLFPTSSIIEFQDLDSVIKTKERVVTIADSLLDVTPKMIQRKTYKIKDGKIESFSVDTTLNYTEYNKAITEKFQPFTFWISDTYLTRDVKEVSQNLKKYLIDYNLVPTAEKKKYAIYSLLQGTYESKDNPFYRKLKFKGKTTVEIVDAFIGFSFPTSYILDGDYVRIQTDKSDLLLQIKDENTLTGDGFASGTFTKVK